MRIFSETTYVPACITMVASGSAASTIDLKSSAMLRLPQQAGAASQPAGRTLGARRPRRTRPRTQPTAHAPGYLAAALRRSARRAGGRSLPPAAHTGRVDGRSAAPRCARRAEAGAVAHGWKAAACEAAAAAAHAASTIFRVMRADPRPAACHAPSPPTVSLPGAWHTAAASSSWLLNTFCHSQNKVQDALGAAHAARAGRRRVQCGHLYERARAAPGDLLLSAGQQHAQGHRVPAPRIRVRSPASLGGGLACCALAA